MVLTFLVVDTDYTNYAVTLVCGTIPMMNKNIQLFWIFGRERTMESVHDEKVFAVLKERGQSTNDFVSANQTNCSN